MKFLNGSSYLQNKVKTFANEWSKYANIKFEYVTSSQNADVKVAFKWNNDKSSWSHVGTYCRNIAQNQPSMNFGWFDEYTSDTEFSRTVIHEFGHALGLKHEHQHPTNSIQWNKPVVYAYYAQQGWNQAKVDQNIFARLSTTQTNYSAYDGYSIMHYHIPASHTIDGYTVGWNTVLSTTDKKFIGEQYPLSVSGKAVPADYDGDGKVDIAIKTPDGGWYIDYAYNGFGYWDWSSFGYAIYDIIPVADYDGDGKADLAIRTSDGRWHIDYAHNGFGRWDASYSGHAGDRVIPVPADYDGDGKADISVKT
ncbi:MAG: FG-GAP-like repeat-containing protein, partial [Dysgonomonas sp.]|nr:FG-GAP-like repeat-containing protein [Dysgonomonas sp.]